MVDRADSDLIKRAQEGDTEAFEQLFEPLRSLAFAVAVRIVGQNDAEDVVMTAFLKAWQALPRFSGKSSLKTWLYRITHNCALDHIRSRQRRKEVSLQSDDDDRDMLAGMPDTEQRPADEIVANAELAERIDWALLQLPSDHRVALELRFNDGLSYAEIAASTGVSIGTVMSRLFYGKRKLQRILEEEGEE